MSKDFRSPGHAGTCPVMSWEIGVTELNVGAKILSMLMMSIFSKRLSRGQNRYGTDADWDVLDGVHTVATWRIRLYRRCAAAMRPYVKLLWSLVIALLHGIEHCTLSGCIKSDISYPVYKRIINLLYFWLQVSTLTSERIFLDLRPKMARKCYKTNHVVLTVVSDVVVLWLEVVESAVRWRREVEVEPKTLRRPHPAAHGTVSETGRL